MAKHQYTPKRTQLMHRWCAFWESTETRIYNWQKRDGVHPGWRFHCWRIFVRVIGCITPNDY